MDVKLLLQGLGALVVLIFGVIIGEQVSMHHQVSNMRERIAAVESKLSLTRELVTNHIVRQHQISPPTPYGSEP